MIEKYQSSGIKSGLRLLNFACYTLASLCSTLARFEKHGVVHRQMNLDSIKLRFSKNQQIYRLSKIDSFDLAIVLKKKTTKVV